MKLIKHILAISTLLLSSTVYAAVAGSGSAGGSGAGVGSSTSAGSTTNSGSATSNTATGTTNQGSIGVAPTLPANPNVSTTSSPAGNSNINSTINNSPITLTISTIHLITLKTYRIQLMEKLTIV